MRRYEKTKESSSKIKDRKVERYKNIICGFILTFYSYHAKIRNLYSQNFEGEMGKDKKGRSLFTKLQLIYI